MPSRATITIKLLENDKIIQRKILMGIAREMNARFRRSKTRIVSAVKGLVGDIIKDQPEIKELNGGILQAAFGIRKGKESTAIEDIIEAISESVLVELKEVRQVGSKVLKGGMSIYIQPERLSNLLNIPSGIVKSEKGQLLPWLSWLLLAGDKILIADYEVEYKSGTGRSGLATMKPASGIFRVPPSYSGTANNNFITRAFNGTERILARIIRTNLR